MSQLPPLGGFIGNDPRDFVVEEIPAYDRSGEGEHLYLWVEKVGLNTQDVAKRLARSANVRERDVGFAGMKDKNAVTRQWFSLVSSDPDPMAWDVGDGCTILSTGRHKNKIRTGHLLGNRFFIRVLGAQKSDRAGLIAKEVQELGFPNYFGPQRFGYEGRNLQKALGWLERLQGSGSAQNHTRKRQRDRFDSKLLSSVIQSELFNRYTSERLKRRGELLCGEVVRLRGTGSHFVVKDLESERPRFEAGDLLPTGPMIGPKGLQAEEEARALEQLVVESFGLSPDELSLLGKHAPGARRDLVLIPERLTLEWSSDEELNISFVLPAGAYATTLVREFTGAPFEFPRGDPAVA